MANSLEQYAGDGITRNFGVPFSYLSKDHVFVTVNGIDTPFSWITPGQLRTEEAPVSGSVVLVKRITPPDQMVDFTDGSTLVETDLDTASLQPLYVAQEAADVIDLKLGVSETSGAFDAQGRRIENIAAPINPDDAVPKAYADAVITTAAGSAGAAASSAAASLASAGVATTQAGHSETAKTASIAARDKAQKWAEEVENTAVETGKFSARHWAAKAMSWAASVGLPAITVADEGKVLSVDVSGKWSLRSLASLAFKATIDSATLINDSIITFAKLATGAIATPAEILAGTPGKLLTADAVLAALAPVPVPYAASISINCNTGVNFVIGPLTGGAAINSPTNVKVGRTVSYRVVQDATGGRAPTWGVYYDWGDYGVPALSTEPNAADDLTFYCAANDKLVFRGIRRRAD